MSKRKNRAYKRGIPYRDAIRYVIACEGKETEKQYFEQFCQEFQRVEVVVLPTGEDNKSAPIYVLKRADKYIEEFGVLGQDDKVWIVIDMDRWTEKMLGEVAQLCDQKEKFELILSNPCFEVWLYLHLKNPSKPMDELNTCKDYKRQLKIDMRTYHPSKVKIEDFQPFTNMGIEKAVKLDTFPTHRFPNNKATR